MNKKKEYKVYQEVISSNEDFGTSAWVYRTFDMAVDKLRKLNTPL